MTTAPSPTIADPTRLGRNVNRAARLLVYIDGNTDGSTDGNTDPQSQIVTLPEGIEVSVGRSRSCTVSVSSERISRKHLRITRVNDDVTVEDLGSRNGTRVNGEIITGPVILAPGDEVTARPVTIVLTTTGAMRWRRRAATAAVFAEHLRSEVDRGTRYKRQFALAVLSFEGKDELVDEALEQLSGRVRAMDSLGEHGDDGVAMILPELDVAAAELALERIIGVVSTAGLRVRAGLAHFPSDASTPGELLAAARAATLLAGGRTKVVRAEPNRHAPSSAVAEANATKALFAMIDKVAPSLMTVLVYGETGAGKEIAARTLHQRSARGEGPFVVLNCACLPSNLLESELFGHEKGAFTGAESQKTGFFEAANGGTLILDEIGEIEPALQAKLLRVLESHKVIRVGGTRELPVDVRVVCATNRELADEVEEGRFRSDLFYRIAGFTLVVPPLRERRADIEPLAERFARESAGRLGADTPVLSPDSRAAILSYAWPGNIRELRNAIERATVLATAGVIELADLPEALSATQAPERRHSGGNHLDSVERDAIARALEEAGGNQTHAAKNLGLTRRALIYRMEKHGLKKKPIG